MVSPALAADSCASNVDGVALRSQWIGIGVGLGVGLAVGAAGAGPVATGTGPGAALGPGWLGGIARIRPGADLGAVAGAVAVGVGARADWSGSA